MSRENALLFINSSLRNFQRSANFENVVSDISDATTNIKASITTGMGKDIAEEINGFKSITEGLDNLSMAVATANIPNISDQIIKDVSADKTDLEALTGGTIENAFLDVVINVPTPEGINSALNEIATITDSDFVNILENIAVDEFADNLSDIFNKDFLSITSKLKSSVASFNSALEGLLGSGSGNPLLDVVLKNNQALLADVASVGISFSQALPIVKLLREGSIEDAAKFVVSQNINFSGHGLPLQHDEIVDFLKNIDTTISKQINPSESSLNTPIDNRVYNNKWNGSKTSYKNFTLVSTQEELIGDFNLAAREITQLVFVGWKVDSDTRIDAKYIHDYEVKNGENGINEHYIVRQNGTLQRGRPIERESTFLDTHNKYSILVGVPYTGTSINQTQKTTIRRMFEAFYNSWPGGQVYSLRDIDTNFTHCGFDVYSYIRLFGKINYGSLVSSSSTSQLLSVAKLNQVEI